MENFKEFIEDNKMFILGGIFILIFGIQVFTFYYFYSVCDRGSEVDTIEDCLISNLENEDGVLEEVKYFYVDIKGEVKKPGTYKIEEGKRVIDAINLAGGVLKNADTSVNNLSLKVKDEMVIIVYNKDDVSDFALVKEKENIVIENCNKDSNLNNDSCISSKDIDSNINNKDEVSSDAFVKTKLVSINTAGIDELMTLSGVGEAKAKAIIEYREKNGLFKDISEIKNVSGIADSLYENIKDYITT